MTLGRASGTLTKPWSLAQNDLDSTFSDSAKGRTDDTQTWQTTTLSYTLKLTANRSTGAVDISVSTTLPYTHLAIGSILLILLTTLFTTPTHTALIALFVCLPVSFIPLIPGFIHYQRLYRELPNVLDIHQLRITPTVAAPILGFLIGMWLLASSPLYQLLTLLLGTTVTAYTAYAVGYTPNEFRQQFSVLGLVFFSGFPLLLTAGNFGLLRLSADQGSATLLVALICTLAPLTIILLTVYSYLCRIFARQFRDIPNQPISSRTARAAWFGYFIALNLLSLLLITALLSDFGWFDITASMVGPVRTAISAIGVPAPAIATSISLGILALPFIAIIVLWGIHLIRELRQHRQVKTGTTPSNLDASQYPVRIIESPRPLAFVAPVSPRRSVIVLSDTLRDELTRDELQAVIAHEEYHIRNHDPVWNFLGTIFGLVIGGRNAFIAAHDYPRVEQEADHYAAERHGAETLISALRSVEQLQTVTAHPQRPQFTSRDSRTGLTWLFAAPYQVLFGSLILANAHASIDNRVETILSSVNEKYNTG